jgi:type IV pilus assembly protein PilM
MSIFSRSKKGIGYDLGARSIKVASVESSRSGFTIRQLASVPLQEQLIVEGALFDAPGVSERLRLTQSLVDIRGATVASAIRSGREALMRPTEVVRAPLAQARAALATEKTLLPGKAEGTLFELIPLDPGASTPMMKVIAIGARKDMCQIRHKAFRDAMIPLAILDVDAIALYNLFVTCQPEKAAKNVVLLNVGHQTAIIIGLEGGHIAHARQILSTGCQYLVEAIQKTGRFGQDGDSDDLLASEDLPALYGDALDDWINNLASDVTQAVTGKKDTIEEVVLSGGGALVPGVVERLAGRLGVPVSVFNPVEHMGGSEEIRALHEKDGPLYTIALGLAVRAAED